MYCVCGGLLGREERLLLPFETCFKSVTLLLSFGMPRQGKAWQGFHLLHRPQDFHQLGGLSVNVPVNLTSTSQIKPETQPRCSVQIRFWDLREFHSVRNRHFSSPSIFSSLALLQCHMCFFQVNLMVVKLEGAWKSPGTARGA